MYTLTRIILIPSLVWVFVSFYGGGGREKDILWRAYLRLIKHVNSIYKIRIAYEWTEDYVVKYLWSAAGYCLIAIPVLLGKKKRNVAVQVDPKRLVDALVEGGETPIIEDAVARRTEGKLFYPALLFPINEFLRLYFK